MITRARSTTTLHSNLALLVIAVGVLGLIHDARTNSAPASWLNLHALFGVLLWVSVVARFWQRLRQSPRMLPADIRAFCRHVSRRVYLSLYTLLLVDLMFGILRNFPGRPLLAPAEDFQGYLGYGLLSLATIHVLGAACRLLVVHAAKLPDAFELAKRVAKVA